MSPKRSRDMNTWVRSQPRESIPVIRTMLTKARGYRYPRWWFAPRAEDSQRRLLRAWLANVPGADMRGLEDAVEAYLLATRDRRIDHGDPLTDPFSLRLIQLVDITSDPDVAGGTYRDWLRDRFEERRSLVERRRLRPPHLKRVQ